MNIKRIIKMFVCLTNCMLMATAMLLSSCTQFDDFFQSEANDGLRVSIVNSNGAAFNTAGTRATNDGNLDNIIERARVMAFRMSNGGSIEFNKAISIDATKPGDVSMPLTIQEGEYIFVAVCNEDEDPDLSAKLNAITNYNQLNSIRVNGNAFGSNKRIIMIGNSFDSQYTEDGTQIKPEGVITIDEAGLPAGGYKITVPVMRLASRLRFTVYSKQHNAANGEAVVGKLTDLKIGNLPGQMGIDFSNYNYTSPSTVTVDGGVIHDETLSAEESNKGYVTKQSIERVIIPSSLTPQKSNAAKVTATFESGVELEGIIQYTDNSDPDNPSQAYALYPNGQYHVTLAAGPDNMRVETQVEDWIIESLTEQVGKTYELSSVDETYIPYAFYSDYSGSSYNSINEKDACAINVKFLVNRPPYSFTIVNDELGIAQTVTMTQNEEKILVNVDAIPILKKYDNLNDTSSSENESFWGFKLPSVPYIGAYYGHFSRTKKFTFRLENITADGGRIKLPSTDFLPECNAICKLNFISCTGGEFCVTQYANLYTTEPTFTLVQSENLYLPTFENINDAREHCKKYGPNWRLADYTNGVDRTADFSRPLRYALEGYYDGEWFSYPGKSMYGWMDGLKDGNDLVSSNFYIAGYMGGFPSMVEPIDPNSPHKSATITEPKHPICVLARIIASPYTIGLSRNSAPTFLIIDPSGVPYDLKNLGAYTISNRGGTPVDNNNTLVYKYDIKVTIHDRDTDAIFEFTDTKTRTIGIEDSNLPDDTYTVDLYNQKYWSAGNWAGDGMNNGIGRGVDIQVELKNATCNGLEASHIGNSPHTLNYQRMQAYKTKNGEFLWEMDRNAQAQMYHTPESAFNFSIDDVSRNGGMTGYGKDVSYHCGKKFGEGWRAPTFDEAYYHIDDLKNAGVMQPGRVYYTSDYFSIGFTRLEGNWPFQKWVWYYNYNLMAYDTNTSKSRTIHIQKNMSPSAMGYQSGIPTGGYLLCVKKLKKV